MEQPGSHEDENKTRKVLGEVDRGATTRRCARSPSHPRGVVPASTEEGGCADTEYFRCGGGGHMAGDCLP